MAQMRTAKKGNGCQGPNQRRRPTTGRFPVVTAGSSIVLLVPATSLAPRRLFVVHEAPGEPERDQGEREDDDPEYPGHGGRVAHAELLEGDGVKLDRIHQGGVGGTADGVCVRLV